MKIVLFGAKGMVGTEILNEALSRSHEVTVVVRDPATYTAPDGVTVVAGDSTNPADVSRAAAGHEAAISAVGPGRNDNPQPHVIPATTTALLEGLPAAGVQRVLIVGGASSLEVAPGVQLFDTPEFPDAYKPEADAGRTSLNLLKNSDTELDWTFFSPSLIIEPGERTSTFRIGGDQLLTDATGASRISTQDFAIAILNELEQGQHLKKRITIGY